MSRLVIIVLSIVFLMFSCKSGNDSNVEKSEKTKKETTENAIAYNETMNNIHSSVDVSFYQVLKAIDDYNIKEAVIAMHQSLIKIELAKQNVNELKDFDGNDEFKNEMLILLTSYEEIMNNEFTKIIEMLATEGDFTFEMLEQRNDYYGSALNKYDDAIFKFIEYQKIFANKWHFQLEEVAI